MCGIAGIRSPEHSFSLKAIESMTERLSHRGPDNSNTYTEGMVALGHRRLSIIDLSDNANQPMQSVDQRYVMVYNGEVYNFREIGAYLEVELKTHSDTEVVLEAFAQWGPGFVEKLNGMFAMAIYDRTEECLHLWRDRLGIKPLYYYYDGRNFAFASELKAILELPIARQINREALQDYLFLEYIPEPHTIFKHIYKLEKGHYLKVNSAGIKKLPYFDLLEQLTPSSHPKKENEYLDELDNLLTRSVKRRMISDVPLGAFLSGGTDSSAICAKFREISDVPINTFTIGFHEQDHDESAYAGAVADQLGSNHHLSVVNARSSLDLVSKITNYYDEPFAVSSVIPMLQVSENASQHVKVVMSGDGGDELFMGYGHYYWSKRIGNISKLGGAAGRKTAAWLLNLLDNRSKRAARVFNYTDQQRLWLHIWSQEQYMFTEKEIGSLMGTPYQHETILKDWQRINALPLHEFDKISLFDIRHYLANDLLHKVDIATMSKGLEARVPFLDHELVKFAINLPHDFKIRGNTQKYLLKKWLEQKLPRELVYREKWGFPAPVGHWLKHELKSLIDTYLSEKALQKTQLFNYQFVKGLIKEFEAGRDYHHKRLWALICFQMWHEQYMS